MELISAAPKYTFGEKTEGAGPLDVPGPGSYSIQE